MASNALAVVRPDDLAAARAQMGFSLAWHVVLACLGVGLPLLTVLDGLSLLVGSDPNMVITGLDRVPRDLRPPVTGVHLSFDLMVGVGFFLLALGVWFTAECRTGCSSF
jgi:cytochrome d ubiquinol oxidase subunit I